MTVEEITREARAVLPDVNTSTVYRTLNLLVSLDLVTRTRLGGAVAYYEVAPDPVHHHWICERCGAVGHLDEAAFAPVYRRLSREQGFEAGHIRATVFGLCRECRGLDDPVPARSSASGEGRAHP
jgi:Fur family ferric uptake transcriptional regulator